MTCQQRCLSSCSWIGVARKRSQHARWVRAPPVCRPPSSSRSSLASSCARGHHRRIESSMRKAVVGASARGSGITGWVRLGTVSLVSVARDDAFTRSKRRDDAHTHALCFLATGWGRGLLRCRCVRPALTPSSRPRWGGSRRVWRSVRGRLQVCRCTLSLLTRCAGYVRRVRSAVSALVCIDPVGSTHVPAIVCVQGRVLLLVVQ